MTWRQVVATLMIAAVAVVVGVFAGERLLDRPPAPPLHDLVHHDLALDAAQLRQIEALEAQFAVRRKSLEAGMRAANSELAAAIAVERAYGPRVTAAVDHFHAAMGDLQKATIEHIFAMRAVMRPDQAARLDRTVVKALTADPA
jgi:hypothetical protein